MKGVKENCSARGGAEREENRRTPVVYIYVVTISWS